MSSGETGSSRTRAYGTTSADTVAVAKRVGEARPSGVVKHSVTSESVLAKSSDGVESCWNSKPVPPFQQSKRWMVSNPLPRRCPGSGRKIAKKKPPESDFFEDHVEADPELHALMGRLKGVSSEEFHESARS